jgi:hypothetical protein
MLQDILTKEASSGSFLLKTLNSRKAKGILSKDDMVRAKKIVDDAAKRRLTGGNMKRFTDTSKARNAISREMLNG